MKKLISAVCAVRKCGMKRFSLYLLACAFDVAHSPAQSWEWLVEGKE